MPRITHRKEEDVPAPPAKASKVSKTLQEMMDELLRVAPGMVMVVETGQDSSIRATKTLITRAGNELGIPVEHWHDRDKVYARPSKAYASGLAKSERWSRGDHRE